MCVRAKTIASSDPLSVCTAYALNIQARAGKNCRAREIDIICQPTPGKRADERGKCLDTRRQQEAGVTHERSRADGRPPPACPLARSNTHWQPQSRRLASRAQNTFAHTTPYTCAWPGSCMQACNDRRQGNAGPHMHACIVNALTRHAVKRDGTTTKRRWGTPVRPGSTRYGTKPSTASGWS